MMWSVPERQPELAGEYWRATGVTRLESRLWGLGLCGGGCIDPRGLSGTRHYYTMPNGKVKRPRTIFSVFLSVGRTAFGGRPLSDGLWPSWFGGKEKPPTSADFRDDADSGGEIAPSSWVTNPRARTLRRFLCGAHITYIMSS